MAGSLSGFWQTQQGHQRWATSRLVLLIGSAIGPADAMFSLPVGMVGDTGQQVGAVHNSVMLVQNRRSWYRVVVVGTGWLVQSGADWCW